MNDIKKRMVIELLISPWSLFPIVGGMSVLMLCWALNTWNTASWLALLTIVGGICAGFTNLTFNLPSIAKKAAESLKRQAKDNQENELNELHWQLDHKYRYEWFNNTSFSGLLKGLRKSYGIFLKEVEEKNPMITLEITASVDKMFNACVKSMHELISLKESPIPNDVRLKRVKTIHQEVSESIELIDNIVSNACQAESETITNVLSAVKDDLSIQIEAARRTKERLDAMTGKRDFSEYEKE